VFGRMDFTEKKKIPTSGVIEEENIKMF